MSAFAHRLASVATVVVFALLAAVVPVASGSAATTGAQRPQFGVQWHAVWTSYTDAQRVQVLDAMKGAGAEWVRIDIGWDMIENEYPGHRDPYWTGRIDAYINMAVDRGLKPLVTLYQTPEWARPAGTSNRTPPTDPATYASFAGWAAQKWAGKVAAWEIWNEPNLEHFWVGTDPVRYAELVRAAYPAFKAGDPSALVVAGAVSYNDDEWLGQMYAAGAAGYFDVLSTHPYQGQADSVPELADGGERWYFTHVPAVRALMDAHGDAGKPIWFTEFGWSSHANDGTESPWAVGVTEQQQADYLVRAIELTRTTYPYVTNMIWYNERDRVDSGIQDNNYGLLRSDLTPKPVFTALRNYLSSTTSPAPVAVIEPVTGVVTDTTKPGSKCTVDTTVVSLNGAKAGTSQRCTRL